MDIGKCPKCGKMYQLSTGADGVGGRYVVYIHKKVNKSGRMVLLDYKCMRSIPGEPAKITGPIVDCR